MLMKCCNPECGEPFDYRQGRLIRVSRPADGKSSLGRKAVEHFWICEKCSDQFVLEHGKKTGVTLRSRDGAVLLKDLPEIVTAA